MLRPAPGSTLHLVLGAPAKEALGAFLAQDVAAGVWQAPAYQRGDLLLTVLDSRPRMLLCLETTATSSSRGGGYIRVEEVWPLAHLLPVGAVEARLGRRFPVAPGPVPGHLTELLLDALEAELADPTPISVREGARCLDSSRERASGLQMIVLEQSGGVCSCCGREHLGLFAGKGLAAMEVHHLQALVEDQGEVVTGPGDLVAVCGACHNILHSTVKPSVQELRYEWRPACPECGERRAQTVQWGMPEGPPPEDVVVGGCDLPVRPEDWRCVSCGYRWIEVDEPVLGKPGWRAREMLREGWPAPHESTVYNFGSDRLHVALERDADGYCESAFWTAEGGEYVEELCPRGTMKNLCIALERRLPLVLAAEGLDPESWG